MKTLEKIFQRSFIVYVCVCGQDSNTGRFINAGYVRSATS